MGHIIKLNTTFTAGSLPKLVDYDTSDLEARIIAMPNLVAFFDATSDEWRTVTDAGKVTKLVNRGKKGGDLIASDSLAPSISHGIFSGTDGVEFSAAEGMTATGVFSGLSHYSIVVFLRPKSTINTYSIILSSNSSNMQAMYVRSNSTLSALSGGISLPIPSIIGRDLHAMLNYDSVNHTARLTGGGNTVTAVVSENIKPMSGSLLLGNWPAEGNRYSGYIGHVMVFEGDISKYTQFTDLLDEFARRKYRLPTSWS